ncbi:unnamed protein product [Anisakis simplex]|uniref:Ribonuclease H1 n=1 Tax=Anisakis simplex TaxID=6269 RepID=A0A0M3JRL4_ANISI|nr:unnamed protein product [Anisakis simplex]
MKPYYAVARGRTRGVYRTWPECEKSVKGFTGAKFKKFSSEREALDFINANKEGCVPLAVKQPAVTTSSSSGALKPSNSGRIQKRLVPRKNILHLKKKALCKTDVDEWRSQGVPVVYTDGACSSNGRRGAKAGIGVFWGDNSPDNVSQPLASGPPTNNRAELSAVIAALKTAHEKNLTRLIICTDSNLLIQSMNSWIKNWRKNGWKTANGEDVKNKDLIVELDTWLNRIEVRFEHVAGHAGIYGNEKADELARNGAVRYGG